MLPHMYKYGCGSSEHEHSPLAMHNRDITTVPSTLLHRVDKADLPRIWDSDVIYFIAHLTAGVPGDVLLGPCP